MAIVRWNPARDLMQMREEMDRLFSQFVRRGDGEEASWAQGLWAPPVDIYETDDAFMLKAELPGFSKEDVSIEVHENRLIIRGERKREIRSEGRAVSSSRARLWALRARVLAAHHGRQREDSGNFQGWRAGAAVTQERGR